MPAHATHVAQTSTEAKLAFKRNGFALSSRQQKELARSAELNQRAARLREREENGRVAKKRRLERETREREARQRSGVGLATQLIGYSHTQARLKNGMEAFLGYQKKTVDKKEEERRKEEERKKVDEEVAKKIEAAVEEAMGEPWDEEDGDAFDLPELESSRRDHFEDDLDDDTLLEVHDLVMSDPPIESNRNPPAPVPTRKAVPLLESPKQSKPKEDPEFKRIHGPINEILEAVLNRLSEPLVELLSQDTSKDPTLWNPAPALLHKLNSTGLPPHRLRIKVGCVVSLLRDLNSSSQLSKSQHLQILRMEKDRLQCLVLDGQLQGTKTILTRTAFSACHRNDTRFPFQRLQYPIQVAKDFAPIELPKEALQPAFKIPYISANLAPRSRPILKRPQPIVNRNPNFKLPGLPASKSMPSETLGLLDGWDDFLDSGTQIARELSQEQPAYAQVLNVQTLSPASKLNGLPPLSTQDFDFSVDDLIDSPEVVANPRQSALHVPSPKNFTSISANALKKPSLQVSKPLASRPTVPAPASPSKAKPLVIHSALPTPAPQSLKRKVSTLSAGPLPPFKQAVIQPNRITIPASRPGYLAQPSTSFSELGLSTQEAVSFFDDDDDDLAFGSPVEIMV